MSTAASRWRPAPASPKILHFHSMRRSRRKQPSTARGHRINPFLLLRMHHRCAGGGLFNRGIERDLQSHVEVPEYRSRNMQIERRNRSEGCDGGGAIEEEKWMFQAETLRAECKFLRMERDFALKKLERNRIKMERTLRSAVQTLASGKKKIFEGTNVNSVLEKEIEDLSEKLAQLQRSSRMKDSVVRNCSNFDEKAYLLQRRIGKLGELHDKKHLNRFHGMHESNLSFSSSHDIDKQGRASCNGNTENKSTEMDEKEKMEGLSKGMMLERRPEEEEYSVSDSKGVVCPDLSSFPSRQESVPSKDSRCSGHCHCMAIVQKVVEQVRAETEQWSHMQEMLERVRVEMEELQASREYWEKHANESTLEIRVLKHAVEEWKGKALGYEVKACELEQELSMIRDKLQKPNTEPRDNKEVVPTACAPRKQVKKGSHAACNDSKENHQPISLGKQLANERRMLIGRFKERSLDSEKQHPLDTIAVKRMPLKDIENLFILS